MSSSKSQWGGSAAQRLLTFLIPEVDEEHLERVLDRIEKSWTESKYSDYVAIIYERELVSSEESILDERKGS